MTRRHSHDDPRDDVGKDVGVGVVECQLFNNEVLFSPLGKLAGRAIYFTDVFSLFIYFFIFF